MKKKILYLLAIIFLIPIIKVNAATGIYDIYTSSKSLNPGNTFTITVYCKSSEKIGTCEYTLDYDSSKIKLISDGDSSSCNNGFCIYNVFDTTSSKKFTFKAIATGSTKISVKSYSIIGIDEKTMSTTVSPTSVTISNPTPSKPVTYSTNNNLKDLNITGYNLEQKFDKNTLTYSVKVPSNVEEIVINATKEDNTASVTGIGKVKVSEGENKFEIVVTSQKGTKKVYTLNVTVLDENPIEITLNDKTYTIIKRKSSLIEPKSSLFTETTIDINNTKIPALYNELNSFTLIGLKDNEGNVNLYIYDENNKTYTLYQEIVMGNIKLNIVDKNEKLEELKSEEITINDTKIKAYKLTNNYYLFYANNLETTKINLYMYEKNENTVQIFNKELINIFEEKITDTKNLVYIMASLVVFFGILIIIVASSKNRKKKKSTQNILSEHEKTNKKKNNNNLEWTKEVKKVDKKLVLEKEDKTKSIKEVEENLKKEIAKAKKEFDNE